MCEILSRLHRTHPADLKLAFLTKQIQTKYSVITWTSQPPPSDPSCWAALPVPLQVWKSLVIDSKYFIRLLPFLFSLIIPNIYTPSMAAGATSPKRCLPPLLVGQSGRQGGDMVCWQSRQVPNKDCQNPPPCLVLLEKHFWIKITRCLGDQLEGWTPARTRRKTAVNKVKLIFV